MFNLLTAEQTQPNLLTAFWCLISLHKMLSLTSAYSSHTNNNYSYNDKYTNHNNHHNHYYNPYSNRHNNINSHNNHNNHNSINYRHLLNNLNEIMTPNATNIDSSEDGGNKNDTNSSLTGLAVLAVVLILLIVSVMYLAQRRMGDQALTRREEKIFIDNLQNYRRLYVRNLRMEQIEYQMAQRHLKSTLASYHRKHSKNTDDGNESGNDTDNDGCRLTPQSSPETEPQTPQTPAFLKHNNKNNNKMPPLSLNNHPNNQNSTQNSNNNIKINIDDINDSTKDPKSYARSQLQPKRIDSDSVLSTAPSVTSIPSVTPVASVASVTPVTETSGTDIAGGTSTSINTNNSATSAAKGVAIVVDNNIKRTQIQIGQQSMDSNYETTDDELESNLSSNISTTNVINYGQVAKQNSLETPLSPSMPVINETPKLESMDESKTNDNNSSNNQRHKSTDIDVFRYIPKKTVYFGTMADLAPDGENGDIILAPH